MFYKAKPVEVEAIQWTTTNQDDIKKFLNDPDGECFYKHDVNVRCANGVRAAAPMDWILRSKENGLSVCFEGLFEELYDAGAGTKEPTVKDPKDTKDPHAPDPHATDSKDAPHGKTAAPPPHENHKDAAKK